MRLFGEKHPKAVLTEAEVCLIREWHEEFPVGHPEHMGYRILATKFYASKGTIRDICKYRTWVDSPY